MPSWAVPCAPSCALAGLRGVRSFPRPCAAATRPRACLVPPAPQEQRKQQEGAEPKGDKGQGGAKPEEGKRAAGEGEEKEEPLPEPTMPAQPQLQVRAVREQERSAEECSLAASLPACLHG